MDIFIGFSIGIVAAISGIVFSMVSKKISGVTPRIMHSQSRTYAMIAPVILPINQQKPLDTQATRYFDNSQVRVLYTADAAYWIQDHSVYRARIEDNRVVENSEEKLDMMALDKVELEEMIFIIEKLTEGKRDDHWNSGN